MSFSLSYSPLPKQVYSPNGSAQLGSYAAPRRWPAEQANIGHDAPPYDTLGSGFPLPSSMQPQPGSLPQPSQSSSEKNTPEKHYLNLAVLEMMKIAAAVLTLRMAFHMVPKGLSALLRLTEKQFRLQSDNRLLQWLENRISGFKTFMETRSGEHGNNLYKSLMAIIDGLLMLYVGGEVDRYFSKKNQKFKPHETKDPEKVVDKVLLVLIATERIENVMHHLFHWLDKHPSSGRQFIYGELAALTAVLFDTSVKIASDRYMLNKNKRKPVSPSGSQAGSASPIQTVNGTSYPAFPGERLVRTGQSNSR